jgi:type III restriction enzyme
MRFKFDANQEYQVRAIEAVIDLFEGQPKQSSIGAYLPVGQNQTTLLPPATNGQLELAEVIPGATPNTLILSEANLLANLHKIQEQDGISTDPSLSYIEETVDTLSGRKIVRFPNFSVEMETGTGKTYIYLRTALELSRRYGLLKFVIVVPSIAIREGVLKTLQVTSTHFRELFDNIPYRYYVYDSENLSQVRQFALSNSVEFMIMTIDSFNKASNVIRQSTDRLQGETPIHLVQAARPILILDEPQNMESELRIKALSALDPLFALRYSATHRNPYSVVYKLTPFEAYRQGLVKRIEVASVVQENDVNQAFIRLEIIKAVKRTFTARLAVHKLMADGTVKEQAVTVKPGDSLEEITGRTEYAGFDVDEINSGQGCVRFTNDAELKTGEARGADKEAIFEAQIRYTIEEHFKKQKRLKDQGIKVLSLFFIDKVDNYAQEDGLIRRLFCKAFNQAKIPYEEWRGIEPEAVQAAYFAQKKRKGGAIELEDSFSGKSREDEEAYDLIMKEKELLLAFSQPGDDEINRKKKQRCFIFSHSALREGWDNPNIFQICTLNQTVSDIKKRQEVGRGVRLAVNQAGERVRDERVNILTVVANESYERYVERLQSEIEQDYGIEGTPPKPPNARQRGVAKFRKEYKLKPEFKELWERIKHKTRYSVKIDSEKLLQGVIADLDKSEIKPPQVTITRAQVDLVKDSDNFEAHQMTGVKTLVNLSGRYPLPNLTDVMSNMMENATPPVKLTRKTLVEVFKRVKNKQSALDNPQEFATIAVGILKHRLADHLVEGIQYEKIDDWWEMTRLETDVESWMDYLIRAGEHSVFDHVVVDSIAQDPRNSLEAKFAEELEKREDVSLYFKLPSWFTVDTPVGTYNPDWAIVIEDRDSHGERQGKPMLYLVSETKGENWKENLRLDELRKIKCGAAHFGSQQFKTKGALEGVDYKVVTKVSELP